MCRLLRPPRADTSVGPYDTIARVNWSRSDQPLYLMAGREKDLAHPQPEPWQERGLQVLIC